MVEEGRKKPRKFPHHTLQDALQVAQAIRQNMAGKPMNKVLLAEAVGIGPGSSNFRLMLSSSYRYGLTDSTEKAVQIGLTDLGKQATSAASDARIVARREAASRPDVFREFYRKFDNAKVPGGDMLAKILTKEFGVPEEHSADCAEMVVANGQWAGIIQHLSNAQYVLLNADSADDAEDDGLDSPGETAAESEDLPEAPDGGLTPTAVAAAPTTHPNAIFIGHGKNRGPLDSLGKVLQEFKVPFKTALTEPTLGRPIPSKIRDTMLECGSAILIFTKDECYYDADGHEIWRPSENAIHELGAASFQYQERVVIFREKGLTLSANVEGIGYIEFEQGAIEAKTTELLRELIGFGLVRITVA